ncbi:ANTAR domain-containing protein [Burkholderia stabilis]|uniref:ANTAR domain-containing response regulator n=1 Tax=Burkholderia stabilis TaxID=95485 RepID=UPI0008516D7E|nr:ANTAR domain-containing protein [Burkholderia stabilis]AOR69811.1 ANTAR domain-containing protein [Burkholderia stabilis]HDR9492964.1 ANTAR domain-containing protein [Burkholderia stabilis]HDR9526234.1 ANTAR domain-containing protein [Burkholderia stabilis]HDR9533497.1 ANTAR domain-containing protein [Burkholderia stabilis]HDR9540135.1 ANTAR domain-containing protein [Burkholderia stabilis]
MRTRTPIRSTPRLLAELRSLRVMVYYPDDDNGLLLVEQLSRIGCPSEQRWPPPATLPESVDLVILAVRPDLLHLSIPWLEDEARPPVIAVTTYESPTILELMLRIDAQSAVTTPVRSFGLLSAMALACHQSRRHDEYRRRIAQLEQRVMSARTLQEAKTLLMQHNAISEEEAYQQIRSQAMERRISINQLAEQIVHAHALLKR